MRKLYVILGNERSDVEFRTFAVQGDTREISLELEFTLLLINSNFEVIPPTSHPEPSPKFNAGIITQNVAKGAKPEF